VHFHFINLELVGRFLAQIGRGLWVAVCFLGTGVKWLGIGFLGLLFLIVMALLKVLGAIGFALFYIFCRGGRCYDDKSALECFALLLAVMNFFGY